MTTALFVPGPRLWAPLQGLLRWFAGGTLPGRNGPQPAALRSRDTANPSFATNSIANYAYRTRAIGINRGQTSAQYNTRKAFRTQAVNVSARSVKVSARAWPVLRVMRVLEAGQAPACVGRMVISGRMADVCAELDRLVAREAALH